MMATNMNEVVSVNQEVEPIKIFNNNVKFTLTNNSKTESETDFSRRISVYSYVWDDKHPKFDRIELHTMKSGKKIFLIHNRSDESTYDWSGFIYMRGDEPRINYSIFKELRGFKYAYTYEYDYERFSQERKEFCDLANIEPDINW